MIDQVHTNQQRINKVRSVLIAIERLLNTRINGTDDTPALQIVGLQSAAKEAEGSLEAIEKFMADNNTLGRTE